MLPFYHKTNRVVLEGRTLNNLGIIHTDLGNYAQALEYLEQSLVIRKNMGNYRGEGVAIDNLGRVYNELGQYEKAVQYFHRALNIYQIIGDKGLEGWALHNLGWTYNRCGQYEQAKKYLERALSIHQEIGSRRGESRTTRDLGKLARALGQQKQALVYYKRAMSISQEIQDPFGKGTILQNVALVYIDQTKYDIALACLLIAKQIFEELHSPYKHETQDWIDNLQQKIGKEQFVALLKNTEMQAPNIVDQELLQDFGNETA